MTHRIRLWPLALTACFSATTLSTTQVFAAPAAPPSNTMIRPAPEAVLTRYQMALDQVAQGHLLEARALLETSIRRVGDAPELNLLLAHLLQREGRNGEAREVLQRVANQSPTAALLAQQLAGRPDLPARSASTITTERINTSDDTTRKVTHTRLAITDQRLAKLEQSMLQMVNTARAAAGLTPLTWSEELAEVARAHSAEMRDLNYFSHDSPTKGMQEPMDRYQAAFNRSPRLVAENIYRAWGSQHRMSEEDIRKAHTALMNSAGHRANILLPNATRLGVGIVANENGDLWITQTFDRP
jgi:uncharacterized protein YkwD